MITLAAYISVLLLRCNAGVNVLKTDKFCVLRSNMANLNGPGSGSAPVPTPPAAFNHPLASERSQRSHGVISTGENWNLFTNKWVVFFFDEATY